MQSFAHMARKYELKRRAKRVEETRRRIAQAALDLHSTIGPARTTVTAIAERAGVQRHTVYSHFPAEADLFRACSGLHYASHPLPDPSAWASVADFGRRLRYALSDVYAYYAAHELLFANVVRDAETSEALRAAGAKRAEAWGRIRDALADGLAPHGRRRERLLAAIDLALDFYTWRLLVRRRGLTQEQAVELMVELLACASRP